MRPVNIPNAAPRLAYAPYSGTAMTGRLCHVAGAMRLVAPEYLLTFFKVVLNTATTGNSLQFQLGINNEYGPMQPQHIVCIYVLASI
jgi:hypothetical protein